MPIEIKELHIHIVVNTDSSEQATKKNQNSVSMTTNSSSGDKDMIIAECVEQVLEILQNKRER